MRGRGVEAARRAVRAAVDEVVDGTWFAVIAGSHTAHTVFPGPYPRTLVRMDPQVRAAARDAAAALTGDGGTAIGSWLRSATRLFASVPEATRRHAVLIIDSADDETPEELDAAVREATGVFRCDCRGLGTGWDVRQVAPQVEDPSARRTGAEVLTEGLVWARWSDGGTPDPGPDDDGGGGGGGGTVRAPR